MMINYHQETASQRQKIEFLIKNASASKVDGR